MISEELREKYIARMSLESVVEIWVTLAEVAGGLRGDCPFCTTPGGELVMKKGGSVFSTTCCLLAGDAVDFDQRVAGRTEDEQELKMRYQCGQGKKGFGLINGIEVRLFGVVRYDD
jgi:hypothetical protein